MISNNFINAKEIILTEQNAEDLFTNQEKNATQIKLALNEDFIDELLQKVPNFEKIVAKDIVDIIYKENKNSLISTSYICSKIGIDLKDVDTKYEGTIKLDNKKLQIDYCKHSLCYKQRFTKAHELGHLFKHLINGLQIEFSNEKNSDKQSEPVDTYEDKTILAALQFDSSDLSAKQLKYENEANQFTRELLLNDYSSEFLIKNKKSKLSADKVISYFGISKDTLIKRLEDKDETLSNILKDDISQLSSTF